MIHNINRNFLFPVETYGHYREKTCFRVICICIYYLYSATGPVTALNAPERKKEFIMFLEC